MAQELGDLVDDLLDFVRFGNYALDELEEAAISYIKLRDSHGIGHKSPEGQRLNSAVKEVLRLKGLYAAKYKEIVE